MPIERNDKAVVRHIVEDILKDHDDRRICLGLLAEGIEYAAQVGSGVWATSLRDHPDGIRLNVGRLEMFSLGRHGDNVFLIAVRVPAVPQILLEELTQRYAVLDSKALPQILRFKVPIARIQELLPQLRPGFLEAIQTAAASVQSQTPYRGAHSPGVIDYLRSETGKSIPQPSYAADSAEQEDVEGTLVTAFETFRKEPLERLRVAVRLVRAEQIRRLLTDSYAVDLDAFNREVWLIESATSLNGRDFKGRIFSRHPLTPAEIDQVETALADGTLEMHGNMIWRPASGVYGPKEPDRTKKQQLLREAIEYLNDATFTPQEKADLVHSIYGFGLNTATGLVMVFHPEEYALYNVESAATLRKLGYDVSSNAAFQKSAQELKDLVAADDFIELDWFLYLYARGRVTVEMTEAAPTGDFGWVNQGDSYEPELEGGFVWAPQRSKDGKALAHHVNVSKLEIGDLIFHYANSAVRAVSKVIAAPVEAERPASLPAQEWITSGFIAKVQYHTLPNPIRLDEIPSDWRTADAGPFDRNGGVKQQYLNPLSAEFVDKMLQKFAGRLPNVFNGTTDGGAEPAPSRIVKIAPGANASYWEDCLAGGFICVGWDEVGDLRQYSDKAAFREAFKDRDWYDHPAKYSAKANELWTLLELQPGDVVVANQGTSKVLAVGRVVEPGYAFREDRDEFKHTVTVEWDTSVAKDIPKQPSWATVTVAPVSEELYRFILGKSPLPPPPVPTTSDTAPDYIEPSFEDIRSAIAAKKLRISERDLRRYHISLKTRGFVIVSGLSGTGKTWLAQAYAEAIGAEHLLVPVAPNWTTNEDLLGYYSPLTHVYHDTAFSRFLRKADAAFRAARAEGRPARPYHLILDEMNLARVEYYFARFLSAMELRARSADGDAPIELGPNDSIVLPPNFAFVGTVNMDETTHNFADKVYDRAQLIELGIDRESLSAHLGSAPYASLLLAIWDVVHPVAPFAFRVIDEIRAYVEHAEALGFGWEEALDEQLLQKILPKLKGAEPRVGKALSEFLKLTQDTCPLSHRKASRILDGYSAHGIASYF